MVEITGKGFKAVVLHELADHEYDVGDADLHVYLDSGDCYAGTLYTLESIARLLQKFAATGECAYGRYYYDPTMLIVRDLRPDTIRGAVEDLIQSGTLAKVFARSVR